MDPLPQRTNMLQALADLSARVSQAGSLADVTDLLEEAAACIGADSAVFVSSMRDDDSWQSYRFIVAGDMTWCQEYEAGGFYRHDPWLRQARQQSEAVLAEDVPVSTPQEQAVVDLARRYGFVSALIIPAHSPQGLTRQGALCLGSRRPGFFNAIDLQTVVFAATLLALRMHHWQIAHLRQRLLKDVPLTAEDLMLLRFQRQGWGSKDIARALNCSPLSVDSRWQRLNAKLGVTSRVAAAHLAAEYGLI